jgi:hypothetical protein
VISAPPCELFFLVLSFLRFLRAVFSLFPLPCLFSLLSFHCSLLIANFSSLFFLRAAAPLREPLPQSPSPWTYPHLVDKKKSE